MVRAKYNFLSCCYLIFTLNWGPVAVLGASERVQTGQELSCKQKCLQMQLSLFLNAEAKADRMHQQAGNFKYLYHMEL